MAGRGRDAEPDRVDGAFGRLLSHVERQVARLVEATLNPEGLTVDQWRVLDLLADGAGHTMSEIAGLVVVPGPTLTKIVDRLVDSAAVYRLVDARDRRRVLAFLSDSGRALHARLEPRVLEVERNVLAGLGDDAPALLGLLARLADDALPSATSRTSGAVTTRP